MGGDIMDNIRANPFNVSYGKRPANEIARSGEYSEIVDDEKAAWRLVSDTDPMITAFMDRIDVNPYGRKKW